MTNTEKLLQTQKTQPENDDVIDLLPIFKSIWQRKWSIITIVMIVMLLTYLVVMTIKPTYRATATMQIQQKETNVVSIEQIYGIDSSKYEYLFTQFELLKSRSLAEKVVEKLNLTKYKEFDPAQQEKPLFSLGAIIGDLKSSIKENLPGLIPTKPKQTAPLTEEEKQEIQFQNTVSAVMSRVTISPLKKTELVYINADFEDPEMAAKVANAIGNAFIDSQLDAAVEATVSATAWMNSRLSELKVKLKDSENKLQAFKDKEGLIDVNGIVTVSADELSAINQRLVDARGKRAEAQSQYRQVKGIKKKDWKKLATLPAVLSHPLIQTFKTEEARAQAKVDELSKRYGKRHPAMQSAISDLKAAQASLKSQVLQIVAGIEREYQIAAANEWSLRKSVDENKQQIKNISKNDFKLKDLQREVDGNRVLFDTFMNRLKETTATVDLESANARIVDKAIVPGAPIKPNKKLIVIIAGFLAGLFSVFLILLLNALNNTFKNTEDVESKLNLPVLGILPLVKKNADTSVAQIFHKNANKIFSECVRTIRTSVMLSSIDKPHKLVVVTSSIPGEGKSTVSINIADAIGQMEKTLLLEADMRRPTISKALNLAPGTPGLANLIAGNANYEECVQSLYGGIDAISAGVVPPNPLELLASEKFKTVLKELESQYDRIIIDCPPVSAVSDALLLSTMAESVIFVIKSDSTDQKLVQKSIGALLQNNAPIKGVVLNQVDIKKAQKNGGSYSGYYDYYGYSQDSKTSKA